MPQGDYWVVTLAMNDREFREHLIKKRPERERKEAHAANVALKNTSRYREVPKRLRRRAPGVAR